MFRQYLKPRIVFIIIATAILIGSLFAVVSYLNSYSYLNINLGNVSSLNMYSLVRNTDGPPDISDYSGKKPEKVILKNGKYKLKKKYYFYEAKPTSNDYQSQTGTINPNENQSLNVNLNLTKEKLAQLYSSQKTNILNALTSKYPTQMQNYNLERGSLYLGGSWFAGYLIPKDNSDRIQVILKQKENTSTWQVMATPNISISSAEYPDIPKEVVDGVNVRPN